MKDSGRVGKAETGSRPTGQAPSGLDAARVDPARFRDLAERCETTRDGDMVELLEEAFSLCFPKPTRVWVEDTGDWTPEYVDYLERSSRFNEIMEAGAFLDTARELLAPHTLWAVGSMEDGPFARLCWPMPDGSYLGGYVEGYARGAALSMAAAALRGHAIATEAAEAAETAKHGSVHEGAGPSGHRPKDVAHRSPLNEQR